MTIFCVSYDVAVVFVAVVCAKLDAAEVFVSVVCDAHDVTVEYVAVVCVSHDAKVLFDLFSEFHMMCHSICSSACVHMMLK